MGQLYVENAGRDDLSRSTSTSTMGGGWGVEDCFIAALDCAVEADAEDKVTGFIIRRGLDFGAAVLRCSSNASPSLLEGSLSCSAAAFVALDRRLLRREAAALATPRILSSVGGVGASFVLVRRERELWFAHMSMSGAIVVRVYETRRAEP